MTSSPADWWNWLHTLSASVPETATEGIALAVASALASIADELSGDRVAANSVDQTAITRAGSRTGSPAFEPVVVARKPLTGTVAGNVQQWGTGALNIDGTRIGLAPGDEVKWNTTHSAAGNKAEGWTRPWMENGDEFNRRARQSIEAANAKGRWPANVVLDSDSAELLDQQSGTTKSRSGGLSTKALGVMNDDAWLARDVPRTGHDDTGGASRFFYTAKADSTERPTHNGVAHPTVKPLDLMRWLVRLVTPPGGIILEPFAGSGTTVEAAILEGFQCIAIERETDYLPLIVQRINRRRDPVAYLSSAGEDMGLFGPEDAA